MPVYICPNCKNRSVDVDGFEGFSGSEELQCRRCGFGFVFQLLEDYYPAPSTGFVVCDADGRVLAVGRGVFELDRIPRDGSDGMSRPLLSLSDTALRARARVGVHRLGAGFELRTRGPEVVVDLFPAYDDDGGVRRALVPLRLAQRGTASGSPSRP